MGPKDRHPIKIATYWETWHDMATISADISGSRNPTRRSLKWTWCIRDTVPSVWRRTSDPCMFVEIFASENGVLPIRQQFYWMLLEDKILFFFPKIWSQTHRKHFNSHHHMHFLGDSWAWRVERTGMPQKRTPGCATTRHMILPNRCILQTWMRMHEASFLMNLSQRVQHRNMTSSFEWSLRPTPQSVLPNRVTPKRLALCVFSLKALM